MKSLAKYLKNYKKESILAPAFKLLEAVFDLLVPVAVAKMIDTGTGGRGVYLYFAALILMAAVGFSCSIVAQYFAAKASVGFAGDVRNAMFSRIQSLSFSQLDTIGGDTLITRISNDVNQMQNGLNLGLRLLLRSPFIVLGATVMAFTIDLRCAAVFAVTVPVLFAIVFFIMQISIPLFGNVQGKLDRVTALTRENLTGVRVVRAFCREDEAVNEYDRENRALTKLNLFVGRISAVLNPLTYVFINIATVFLIKKAAVRVNLGTLTQGQVVALYNYMLQIIVELIKLASLIITLNKSAACAKRAAAVLDTRPDMEYPESEAVPESGAPVVEFKNVSFTYSGAGGESLSDISFAVNGGEKIGVIGGTGSGKTTLINLIPRFYDATSGTVRLFGKNVKEYTSEQLCAAVAVVEQKAAIFKGTIRENLLFGNSNASDADLSAAVAAAQAEDVIKSKSEGLDFVIEQNGKNLSGGQKQRLTIARALLKKSPVLILDDSSSALDFATDARLRKVIGELKGVIVFTVSQRISSVRGADKIIVLDNGRAVGIGTHEQLLQSCEVYHEIYSSQNKSEKETENGVNGI